MNSIRTLFVITQLLIFASITHASSALSIRNDYLNVTEGYERDRIFYVYINQYGGRNPDVAMRVRHGFKENHSHDVVDKAYPLVFSGDAIRHWVGDNTGVRVMDPLGGVTSISDHLDLGSRITRPDRADNYSYTKWYSHTWKNGTEEKSFINSISLGMPDDHETIAVKGDCMGNSLASIIISDGHGASAPKSYVYTGIQPLKPSHTIHIGFIYFAPVYLPNRAPPTIDIRQDITCTVVYSFGKKVDTKQNPEYPQEPNVVHRDSNGLIITVTSPPTDNDNSTRDMGIGAGIGAGVTAIAAAILVIIRSCRG